MVMSVLHLSWSMRDDAVLPFCCLPSVALFGVPCLHEERRKAGDDLLILTNILAQTVEGLWHSPAHYVDTNL